MINDRPPGFLARLSSVRSLKACRSLVVLVSLACLFAGQCSTSGTLADDIGWKVQVAAGDKKLELQDLNAAEVFYRQAVKDVCHTAGATADEKALCMQKLGDVLQMKSESEDAMHFYKKELHVLEHAHGKNSKELLPVLLRIGGIFEADGDLAKSAKFYQRSIDIARKTEGAESLSLADARYRMGRVQVRLKKFDVADLLYNQALTAIMQQRELPSDELVENVLDDYIDLLRNRDNLSQRPILTNEFQKELLKDRADSFVGGGGSETSNFNTAVSAKMSQAPENQPVEDGKIRLRPFLKTGSGKKMGQSNQLPPMQLAESVPDFAASEKLARQRITFYERMIGTDIASLGANHPSVARDLYGLACVYLAQKKYSEARPLLKRALTIYSRVYSADAQPIVNLKTLIRYIDEERSAPPNAQESATDYMAKLPPVPLNAQKLEVAFDLNYLGLLLVTRGRLVDADRVLAWALATTALSTSERSILTAACLNDYSCVLRAVGKLQEAETMESDARIILRRAFYERAALALPN